MPETSEQLYWIIKASPYATAIEIITMQADFMFKLEWCMDLEKNSIPSY